MKTRFLNHYRRRIYRSGAEELLEWLEARDFFQIPASTRFHSAREGGLVEHSVHVYERLRRLFMLEFTNGEIPHPEQDESIAICGLLHGVGMVKDDIPLGDAEKSICTISSFMKLTYEEVMAIRWHKGFADNDFKAGGNSVEKAFEKYPLALLTHIAGLQATYLDGVEGAGKR